MFWKRNENKLVKNVDFKYPGPPRKRSYSTMFEMLIDSEKYDNKGEIEVSVAILTNLSEFIERYKKSFIDQYKKVDVKNNK